MRRTGTFLLVASMLALAQAANAQPAKVIPPTPIPHADAPYPDAEASHPREVTVVLNVTVGMDGAVTDPEVVEPGGGAFDEAALAAVQTWLFSPAQKAGKPVRARIRVPVHFLPPAAAPSPSPSPSEAAPPVLPVHQAPAAPAPTPSTSPVPAPAPPAPDAPPGTLATRPAAGGVPAKGEADGAAPQEVEVIGHRERNTGGASDYHIAVGALAAVPVKNASDRLKLAPGIMLSNEGGEGHAEQVFLRGFDAREGQDIEFTVDGVPINDAGNLHGNGYADTHFILPEVITGLRVVEGPFDPAQGNFAVAGSANYELGLEKRGLTTKLSTGSYGTERLVATFGPAGSSTGTFGAVEIYKTDGFGQNRSAQRASAIGQYEGKLGDKGSYRLTATAYATSFQTAGVLREDDYESGRKGFYDSEDPQQGGNSSRFSLAADVKNRWESTDFELQVFAVRRTMRLRENFTGYLLDTQDPFKTLHDQRGDLLDLDYTGDTLGARATARYTGTLFDLPQSLELGLYARGDDTSSTQYRVEAATNAPYHLDTDLSSQLGDIGAYADANVHLLSWLSLRGGVRADLFEFDVLNNCAVQGGIDHASKTSPPGNASCLSQETGGAYREPVQRAATGSSAVMPRGTLLVGPVRNFTLSVSVGKGVRSIDPIYVTQDYPVAFASVTAFEGGVSFARLFDSVGVTAKSVVFQTQVDHDLIFDQQEGRNTLGGGTTRSGWAGSGRVTGGFFDLAANVTLVRATFDPCSAKQAASDCPDAGLLVPYVPDLVVRGDGALFHDLPFRARGEAFRGLLGLGSTYVGRRPLPYGQTSDTLFTLDGSVSLAWRPLELSLAMTNILDTHYRLGEYNYASDFHSQPLPTLTPARMFTAGPPRAVLVSLSGTVGD